MTIEQAIFAMACGLLLGIWLDRHLRARPKKQNVPRRMVSLAKRAGKIRDRDSARQLAEFRARTGLRYATFKIADNSPADFADRAFVQIGKANDCIALNPAYADHRLDLAEGFLNRAEALEEDRKAVP